MSLTNNTAAEAALDDPEQLRQLAAAGRAGAEVEQDEAEKALQAAQVEAQRLVDEAKRRAHQAAQQVAAAGRAAGMLEERAGLLDHAETLRQQIVDTQDTIGALKAEHDDLTEQVDGLDQRLAELGEERENTAAKLAAATNAGDVDAVLAHRARIAAVDEVTATLDSQRQAAHARRTAIVDADGAGELADTVATWERLQAELRRTENELDPTRPEAEWDRRVANLRAAVDAYVADYRAAQAPPSNDAVVVRKTRR